MHLTRKGGAVSKHLTLCEVQDQEMKAEVLGTTLQGEAHLFTLEALLIRDRSQMTSSVRGEGGLLKVDRR